MRGKKILLLLGAVTAGVGLFASLLYSHPKAATKGTTTFTVTTSSYGGKYSPKNAGVAWVTDAQDNFVKTLKLWADKRKNHLIKWNASSAGNVVDAVTGATARAPQTHVTTWDGTDANGALVNDGGYKIYVEFTEDNSASGNTAGKWVAVNFTKGATSQTLTPGDQTYFKAMKLDYAPDAGGPLPATLVGNVLAANSNAALASATVQLQSNGQTLYTATSNASGQYQMQNIAAGNYTLVATKSGYQNYSEAITLAAGQQLTGKNITLTPNVTNGAVSGTVRNANTNAIIRSATVQLKIGAQVQLQTTSNTNGIYMLAAVPPATYTLLVFKDGFNAASENLTIASGQNISNKNIALTPIVNGASLSGTIFEAATNQPLASATVQLKVGEQVQAETTANASGAYAFANVAPGSYTLAALKSGYNLATQTLTLVAGQNVANRNLSLTKTIVPDTTPPPAPGNLSFEVIR